MVEYKWYVYVLECNNGALYTGITNDLFRRFSRHKKGYGAKYTKSAGVKDMVYTEVFATRAEAMRRESEIKSWSKNKKWELVRAFSQDCLVPRCARD